MDYLKKWHEQRKNEIGLDTWESYDVAVTKHLILHFEDKALWLDDVTTKIAYEFYEYLSKSGNRGLSQSSMKKISSALKICFKSAVMIGLIEVDPTTEVKLPKTNNKQSAVKTVYMNKDEAKKFLKAFEGEQLFPLELRGFAQMK